MLNAESRLAMDCSAEQTLRTLEPGTTRALVDDGGWLAVSRLAAQFPQLGGSQYLNCRLGPDAQRRVDWLVAVTRLARHRCLVPPFSSSADLDPFNRLLERWCSRRSNINEIVPVVWLEFDDVRAAPRRSASVCACIVPSYIEPFAPLTSLPPDEQVRALVELTDVIRGAACSVSERALLSASVRALPPGAHWIHLSVMTAREPVELELYGVFPQHSLIPYLERIAWPGDTRRIAELLARYCPPARTGSLIYVEFPLTRALELGEAALGICFSRQQLRASLETDPRRPALLRALCDDALCGVEQASALAAWHREPAPGAAAGGARDLLERWFDLKLLYRSGQPLQANACLGLAAAPGAAHVW
jgi:hypothetical protein